MFADIKTTCGPVARFLQNLLILALKSSFIYWKKIKIKFTFFKFTEEKLKKNVIEKNINIGLKIFSKCEPFAGQYQKDTYEGT